MVLLPLWAAARSGLDNPIDEPPDVVRGYAENGDPSSQFHLALFYTNGTGGFKRDPAEGAKWYRKSASSGYPEAQYNLGVMYSIGLGVTRDDKEAVKWFRQAAAAGLFEAQRALISCSARGTGTPASMGEALKWDFLARRSLELRFEKPAGSPPKPATLRPDGFAEYVTPDGDREAISPVGMIEHIGPDGSRRLDLPNGGTTVIQPDGSRRTQNRDGSSESKLADGTRIVRSADGTVETTFPDGTRTRESNGRTEDGGTVRITEQFDKSGNRISESSRDPKAGRAIAPFIPEEPLIPIHPTEEALPKTTSSPPPQPTGPSVLKESADINKQLDELAKLERELRYFAGASDADYENASNAAHKFLLELGSTPQRKKADSTTEAPPPPAPLRPLRTDRSESYPLGFYGHAAISAQPWKHAETSHFVVHYVDNSSASAAMHYIECAFYVVTEALQIDTRIAPRKIHVFVFPDPTTWKEFKSKQDLPPQVSGFAYKDELFLGAQEERFTYIKVLCHESTHAIVAHFYPGRKWPLWLNEGFAEYMGAKSLAVRRHDPVSKYMGINLEPIQVASVINRVRYGTAPGAHLMPSGMVASDPGPVPFYAQSERCVSVLLERLPPEAFPRFANLVLAGNSVAVSLREAYGQRCPDLDTFQSLVN